MKAQKMQSYEIIKCRYDSRTDLTHESLTEGTLRNLTEIFFDTLYRGVELQMAEGAKPVDTEPKTFKALLESLNAAEFNKQLFGWGGCETRFYAGDTETWIAEGGTIDTPDGADIVKKVKKALERKVKPEPVAAKVGKKQKAKKAEPTAMQRAIEAIATPAKKEKSEPAKKIDRLLEKATKLAALANA